MANIEQKYVRYDHYLDGNKWLLGPSGAASYMASQCVGESGLEKDLKAGWIVKYCWEDRYQIVFLLERSK